MLTIGPCPFCPTVDDDDLRVVEIEPAGFGEVSMFAVECIGCSARGPAHLSEGDAKSGWNERT